MRQRLGFAIATASAPRILLMDEALAVGDKHFRARSIERVTDLRDGAGTVIMAVSYTHLTLPTNREV